MLTDALRGTAVKITLSSQQFPVPSHLLKSYIFHSHVFEICDIALVFLKRKKNRLKVAYLIMQWSKIKNWNSVIPELRNILFGCLSVKNSKCTGVSSKKLIFFWVLFLAVFQTSMSYLNGKLGFLPLESKGCLLHSIEVTKNSKNIVEKVKEYLVILTYFEQTKQDVQNRSD